MVTNTNADRPRQKRHRDGSIKVINGILYARIQYRDPLTGKRKEKLRPAKNRTEARELIKEMRREHETLGPEALESDRVTIAQLADRYRAVKLLPATYQNGIKVSGKRSIGPSLSALIPLRERLGAKRIRAIRPSDIEQYKMSRLAEPVEITQNETIRDSKTGKKITKKKKVARQRKIASVNRELELLRAMFSFARAEGLIDSSPFDRGTNLISPAAEVKRDRVMSQDEENRLLAACKGRREHMRPLIIVAVDTAMRRGELFKLEWRDVDFAQKQLRIRAENAKTEKPRFAGLTKRAYDELQRLWERSPKHENDLVFGIRSTIKNGWKAACDEAGIKDLRFHDLRHTATTRLVRAGVPSSEVMKITGHSQISTFLRYLNLTSESLSASAELLDTYLTASVQDSIAVADDLVH